MTTHHTHNDLHSEQGALAGEHPGRAKNPVIKVRDLAWLEFEKPDLVAAETFAHAFGFTTSHRGADEIHLRGTRAGTPAVIVRRGTSSKLSAAAFQAAAESDLDRLAGRVAGVVTDLPESLGGRVLDTVDPSGMRVRVVHGSRTLPEVAGQVPLVHNAGAATPRTNLTQRPPREPAKVERLGHLVLQSTRYREALDWYLEHLGLIVSDFLFYEGQRAQGPTMSFIRCDRGDEPTDHHTLAMTLGPSNRYVHSAYQVADLDALAAGGEFLGDAGYRRSWGIGRHIQGSQIFDYWRDDKGFLVEHFTDGDLFDASLEPGWAPMTASGLAQWGPPASADVLGIKPGAEALIEARAVAAALRAPDNEFDLARLRGLLKVARS